MWFSFSSLALWETEFDTSVLQSLKHVSLTRTGPTMLASQQHRKCIKCKEITTNIKHKHDKAETQKHIYRVHLLDRANSLFVAVHFSSAATLVLSVYLLPTMQQVWPSLNSGNLTFDLNIKNGTNRTKFKQKLFLR